MKKFLSKLLIAIVSLSAGQTLALTPENTTQHKIEARYVQERVIFKTIKGYVLTIDGKPVMKGETYTAMSGLKEPLSMMLKVANSPILSATTTKVSFSLSQLCPGSGVGEVIQAVVTDKGKDTIVCFESEEDGQLYAMFPFGGF